MKRKYTDRILIPKIGNNSFLFYTEGYLKIANGYEKIIIEKKPMIEFSFKNMCHYNIMVNPHKKWKQNNEKYMFVEYKSKDYCDIKILYNKKKEKFYISIFDLMDDKKKMLITKISRSPCLNLLNH